MSGILIPHKSVNLGMHINEWAALPNRDNYLNHLQSIGIHGIRVPFIYEELQTPQQQDNANWLIHDCYQRGITCTALIDSTAAAGSTRDGNLFWHTLWVYQRYGPDGSLWNAWGFPKDRTINLYEIYNEPNIATSGTHTGYTAAAYGAMVTPIYQQLRCPTGPGGGAGYNDARVRVVCGGLANRSNAQAWLSSLINSGNFYVDHVCCHPYPNGWQTTGNADAKNMCINLRSILDTNNATQQLIITEYSYPYNNDGTAQLNGWNDFENWVANHGYVLHELN